MSIVINKKMLIKQVMDMDRNAAPVFMAYGMHCLFCPHASMESIEDASAVHGVDADELVAKLNEYFAAKDAQ